MSDPTRARSSNSPTEGLLYNDAYAGHIACWSSEDVTDVGEWVPEDAFPVPEYSWRECSQV